MRSVSAPLTEFDSEATQPLVASWVRIVLQPEFAPWSLTLFVARAWLQAPTQQALLNAAEQVIEPGRTRPSDAQAARAPVAPLVLETSALALRCPPSMSVLELFGRRLEIDTARLVRNLSATVLVRVDAASQDELRLTVLNGAVRIKNLRRHPNIFDGTADLAEVWPAPGELTAILLNSTDVCVEIFRDERRKV